MKKFLKKFDGLWALPLAFALFVLVGYLLQSLGGFGTGTYDMAFIQPLFLATAIVIGATNAIVWGLYFTFKDLWKQIYESSGRTEWRAQTPKFRIITALVVFFLMLTALISIYLKLV